jgi:hypothetical protein
MFFRGHIVRLREALRVPSSPRARPARCLRRRDGCCFGIPFFRTWPCRLQLMGSIIAARRLRESRRARTSCPRSWWGDRRHPWSWSNATDAPARIRETRQPSVGQLSRITTHILLVILGFAQSFSHDTGVEFPLLPLHIHFVSHRQRKSPLNFMAGAQRICSTEYI